MCVIHKFCCSSHEKMIYIFIIFLKNIIVSHYYVWSIKNGEAWLFFTLIYTTHINGRYTIKITIFYAILSGMINFLLDFFFFFLLLFILSNIYIKKIRLHKYMLYSTFYYFLYFFFYINIEFFWIFINIFLSFLCTVH